jgi:hypothetical protein
MGGEEAKYKKIESTILQLKLRFKVDGELKK